MPSHAIQHRFTQRFVQAHVRGVHSPLKKPFIQKPEHGLGSELGQPGQISSTNLYQPPLGTCQGCRLYLLSSWPLGSDPQWSTPIGPAVVESGRSAHALRPSSTSLLHCVSCTITSFDRREVPNRTAGTDQGLPEPTLSPKSLPVSTSGAGPPASRR
jgi:hypothetical protein